MTTKLITPKFRLLICLLFLIASLSILYLRINLYPNSIVVTAGLQNDYFPPEIRLNRGNGLEKSVFSSGEISAEPFDDLKAFQITFDHRPQLTDNDFFLVDYERHQTTQTSTWTASLPPSQLNRYQPQSLVFNGTKPNVKYHVIIGGLTWPSEHNNDLVLAQNPVPENGISGNIQVITQQPLLDEKTDIRYLKPDFEGVFFQSPQPVPLTLATIQLSKSFGLLGLQIPMWTWESESILNSFDISGTDSDTRVESGLLLLQPSTYPGIILTTTSSMVPVRQAIESRIQSIRLVLTFAAIAGAGFLYLGLSRLSMLVNKREQQVSKFREFLMGIVYHLNNNLSIPTEVIKTTSLIALLGLLLVNAFTTQLGPIQGLLWLIGLLLITLGWEYAKERRPERGAVRWLSQTASWLTKHHLLIVLLLVIIGAGLLFYRLGEHDFYEDEFQVIGAAAGFLNSGEFYSWDWVGNQVTGSVYNRAWPHTVLIAQSFRLFGISEWSARLVSALFGVGFLIGLYFFSKHFTNKKAALLSLFSSAFYLTFITIFRKTRMYAMLLPIFLLLTYLIYKGLTGDWVPTTKMKFLDKLLHNYLNFDYRYVILALPVFYLNYHVHLNSIVIVLATYIFVCWMAILDKSKKYRVLVWLGLGGLLALLLVNQLNLPIRLPWVLNAISFLSWRNDIYFEYLFRHPFGLLSGSALVTFILYLAFKNRKNTQARYRLMYLLIITITSVLFFSYFADRYASLVYISHIIPIALILIMAGISEIMTRWPSLSILLLGTTVIFVIFNLNSRLTAFYNWERSYGDFSTAYQTIVENYDHENEVIFGQYLRTYYLQPMNEFNHISMLSDQLYTYHQFLTDLEQQSAGWLTWETRKGYHIEPQIITFIDNNFTKLHGEGIDSTMIEVYYYSHDSPSWVIE